MKATTKIRIRRGNRAALPALLRGEIAFCVDTGEVFIGDGSTNVRVTGANIPPGNYGDITVDSLGATWSINDGVVDGAALAPIPQFRLLGRVASGTGQVGQISIAELMTFANNFLALNKIVQVGNQTVLGRATAGTGNVESFTWQTILAVLAQTANSFPYWNGSTWSQVIPGTAGKSVLTSSGGAAPGWSAIAQYAFEDRQTQNTPAGTFTSGSWQARQLNTTVLNSDGAATLALNLVTLPAGSYLARVSCPGVICNFHQARLYNFTDSTVIAYGTSEYSSSTYNGVSHSKIVAYFTLASSKQLLIQHQCQTTRATDGFGAAANFGTEVYTQMSIDRRL